MFCKHNLRFENILCRNQYQVKIILHLFLRKDYTATKLTDTLLYNHLRDPYYLTLLQTQTLITKIQTLYPNLVFLPFRMQTPGIIITCILSSEHLLIDPVAQFFTISNKLLHPEILLQIEKGGHNKLIYEDETS